MIDFDCATSAPLDIVATMNGASFVECDQLVSVVHITGEGVIIDFYEEGELVRTIGRTWEEWYESCPEINEA